jgi:hypothetical protein
MFASMRACASVRSGALTVTFCLIALLLSSCGGGGDSGSSESPGSSQNPPSIPPPPPAPPSPPPQPPAPPVAEAPRIISLAADTSVDLGSTATFRVLVSGAEPISYQWMRDGAPIVGATAASYTTAPVTTADSGARFAVIVSNSAGQATSAPVELTVIANVPMILRHPENANVNVGETATFSVVAIGSTPLTYQWRLNGTAIDGATDPIYTIPSVQPSPTASYDVVVSNTVGFAISRSAQLRVRQSIDRFVDTNLQSYLTALGPTGLFPEDDRVGEQSIPLTGTANITASSFGFPDSLPGRFDVTIELQEFENPRFLEGTFSELPQTLSLSRHVHGTVAGFELDRYDGALRFSPNTFGSRALGMDVLIGSQSGFESIGIGNWKYLGAEQRVLFPGIQTARGSFVLGVPTPDVAISDIPSGEYRGFAHGGLEYVLSGLDRFEEFSSAAHVTYDAATHQVTLTLDGFETYEGRFDNSITSVWPVPADEPVTILSAGRTLTCVTTVDPATNEFSCPLVLAEANLEGEFKGKFYGQEGNQMAGTFSMSGLVRFDFGDGVVGAVVLKR